MVTALLPLSVTDLKIRKRGQDIVGPVSLEIDGSGITILVGPNGAGKTSLLKALHGIERISKGRVSWACDADLAADKQAFVFQTPIMLRRTVRENLAYPLSLRGSSRSEIKDKVEFWASRIGLAKHLDRSAPRLSGGERQKLAIARALTLQPQMLFLDEPCSNLDGRATRDIEDILHEAAASGTRVLMATHDVGQAKRLAQELIFLHKGKLHERGLAPQIFEAPQTAELNAFLSGDIVE